MAEKQNDRRGDLQPVAERLWRLVDEYDRLKESLDDPKVLLTALKQQADLLVLIAKAGDANVEADEAQAEMSTERALNELKDIFTRLQPVLAR